MVTMWSSSLSGSWVLKAHRAANPTAIAPSNSIASLISAINLTAANREVGRRVQVVTALAVAQHPLDDLASAGVAAQYSGSVVAETAEVLAV